MRVEHRDGQAAFLEALKALMEVCDVLDDGQLLAASRCRAWTVGDVLVHVHLGLQEMLLGLVAPTDATPDTNAATYWQTKLPTNDPDADQIAQIQFVRRMSTAYRRPTGLTSAAKRTQAGAKNVRIQGSDAK